MKRESSALFSKSDDKRARYEAGLDLDLKTDISDLNASIILQEVSAPASVQGQIEEWLDKFLSFLTEFKVPRSSRKEILNDVGLEELKDLPQDFKFPGCKVCLAIPIGHLASNSLVFPHAIGNIRVHIEFNKKFKDVSETRLYFLSFLARLFSSCSSNELVASSCFAYNTWSNIPSLVVQPSTSSLSKRMKISLDIYEESDKNVSELSGIRPDLQEELIRLMKSSETYREAYQLLDVWIRQIKCLLPINLIPTVLLHCHLTNQIYVSMKPWQIVRRVWTFIRDSSLVNEQIILGVLKSIPSVSCASPFLDRDGTTLLFPQLVFSQWSFLTEYSSAALKVPLEKTLLTKQESGAIFDMVFTFRSPHLDKCKLMQNLEYGLGNRILRMSGIQNSKDLGTFRVGLNLNPSSYFHAATHGPEIGQADEKKFRSFWGERSELRRFEDGTVKELVLWGQQRAEVMGDIIRAIVAKHHPGVSVEENGNWHSILLIGDGGEKAKTELDIVTKVLYELEGLSLAVSGVSGFGEEARITRVGTNNTGWEIGGKTTVDIRGIAKLSEKGSMAPKFVQCLDVLLYPEYSGKWPKESEAIRRLRVAWLLEIGKALSKQMTNVKSRLIGEKLVVVTSSREVALRLSVGEKGKEYNGHLCQFSSWLNGLAKTYPAWSGGVRLAKRWVSSHLLSDSISESIIEVTMAKIFLNPEQYGCPPTLPVSAFNRWLQLISTHDWNESPVIVSPEMIDSIPRELLPVMAVISPHDPTPSYWTKPGPSWTELQRLMTLAAYSANILEEEEDSSKFMKIFSPSLDVYDFLIELKPYQVSNRFLNFFGKSNEGVKKVLDKSDSVPVVEYNPAYSLFSELKLSYSHIANFYYDKFGGTLIAVKVLQGLKNKVPVSELGGHVISGKETELNWGALVEDWNIIGEGIIKHIHCQDTKSFV